MATTTTTTLMGLVLPIPGPSGELGPTWATDLVTAFNALDVHNHASGSGARITPSAININADLTMANYNLIAVNSMRLINQSGVLAGSSDKLCVYASGGNLYYNNSSGTSVQLTAGSAINVSALGAITGDYSSSGAAISYNNTTKAYSFAQGTPNTTYVAAVSCGSVTVSEQVSGGNGVTIQVPSSLASGYSVTLPATLPGSTLPLSISNSGVLSAATITLAQLTAVVQNALCPTGSFLAYGGTSAPSGFLLCDGSAVSRSTYAALYSAIGVAYGYGDNSTTFNLPDFRGRFLRGRDGGAGNDPDASSRTAMATGGNTADNVGSIQSDSIKAHYHSKTNPQLTVGAGSNTISAWTASGQIGTQTDSTDSTGTNETRPKNANVNWIVKT